MYWWNNEQLPNEGLEIIEVDYVTALNLKEYQEKINKLYEEQKDEGKTRLECENIRQERMKLAAGYKLEDYGAEQEVRLVCFLGDESGAIRKPGKNELHMEAAGGRLRTYIERPVKLAETLKGLDITLGPRVPENDVQH